ncbi:MAG: diguanylate cyclase [Granulosicoccaceae bacterium]
MDINNCHALVVDDDHAITEIVQYVLEQHGVTVSTANSGIEALGIFTEQIIDVVLTDIRMDGMSGFELLKRIQLLDPAVKVIVMTGYDSYDMVLRALQAGAYEYLDKPLAKHQAITASVARAYENALLYRKNANLLERVTASNDKLSIANKRLVQLNKKLKHLAITDSLTQLYNRRYVDQVMRREAQRRNRYHDPLSVIMLDVDNFKQFNDTYGHDGGDRALKVVASALTSCVRNTDVVGRYGGEEFVVVLIKTPPHNARIFAERMRHEIESQVVKMGDGIGHITVSVGIAGIDANDEAIEGKALLINADDALYEAKKTGRNRVVNFDDMPSKNTLKKSA